MCFIIMIDMIRFVSLHEQFLFKINPRGNTSFVQGNNSSTIERLPKNFNLFVLIMKVIQEKEMNQKTIKRSRERK